MYFIIEYAILGKTKSKQIESNSLEDATIEGSNFCEGINAEFLGVYEDDEANERYFEQNYK